MTYALLAIFIPSFFFAVRYGIGTDYYSYIRNYELIRSGNETRMEWGYEYLNKIVASLGGDIEIVFFIIGLLMMLFIYLTLKNYCHVISPGIGMFVFMLLYYQMSFNTVRQAVTMAIVLYSIRFIKDRKLIKFTLLIVLASGFHNSALLFLPIYFIYALIGKKNRTLSRILIYTVTAIIVLSLDRILIPILGAVPELDYYIKYLEEESTTEGIGFLVRSLPFLFIGFYVYKYIGERDRSFILYFSIFIIGMLLNFSRFVGADFISRISLNFEVAQVLLIPYFFRCLNNRGEFLLSWALFCYLIFHWWYVFFYIGSHGTYPYEWIFNK
ncbi:EpsG family protein [Halalkalibacter sp. APA_J-10(15)]|uniref:EpsG family protein n=1 Tax=Halalkalibacter sp. APA_J-10(15) TaxID=2933805 RepID=UPI001FF2472C|nr:EpsG family protein [Halalkalibacter sp. APA_J-10(15)]MCK0470087.1 EpsG family protein [Halalkalibacter sp. APA_J-10(15)]